MILAECQLYCLQHIITAILPRGLHMYFIYNDEWAVAVANMSNANGQGQLQPTHLCTLRTRKVC